MSGAPISGPYFRPPLTGALPLPIIKEMLEVKWKSLNGEWKTKVRAGRPA